MAAGDDTEGRQVITMSLDTCVAENHLPMVSAGSSVPEMHGAEALPSAVCSEEAAQELAAQQGENPEPALAAQTILPLPPDDNKDEQGNDENIDPSALAEMPQATALATPASFQKSQGEQGFRLSRLRF